MNYEIETFKIVRYIGLLRAGRIIFKVSKRYLNVEGTENTEIEGGRE